MTIHRPIRSLVVALAALAWPGCATVDSSDESASRENEAVARTATKRVRANEPTDIPDAEADEAASEKPEEIVQDVREEPPVARPRPVKREAPKSPPVARESVAPDSFDEIIAESRDSGALTAADEAAFRKDLAAMPAALRPQMAQMLLAMRQQKSPREPAETNPLRSEGESPKLPAKRAEAAQPNAAASLERAAKVKPAILQRDVDEPAKGAVERAIAVEPVQGERPEEWRVMLSAAIRSLEEEAAKGGDGATEREALLRMLYLAADRRDDALRPIESADAHERQFWIDWLYGTSVYLDTDELPSDQHRAAVAAARMREAIGRLGEQANLEIDKMAFCRRVTSFGVYEPLGTTPLKGAGSDVPKYVFTANQELLLYAEVRNFTSRETAQGFHTVLRPSYQIFDSQGRRVGSVVELDESHDYCRQRRGDFFVCYHIYLPTRIDAGDYRLKLAIEDVQGQKVRESSLEFSIK